MDLQTYKYVDGKLAHTGNVEFEGCEYCRVRREGSLSSSIHSIEEA
jgi:hypothetical protein